MSDRTFMTASVTSESSTGVSEQEEGFVNQNLIIMKHVRAHFNQIENVFLIRETH